jgi:hypothetical protein
MNSTLNSTNVNESSVLEEIIIDFYMIIAIVGLISNLFCINIFSRINTTFKTNGQLYKYLLVKAICDFCFFVLLAINTFYKRCSDTMRNGFILQFFYIFYHFSFPIIELYSVYFEVLGTIDCYLSIENKYKHFLTKKAFKLSSSVIVVFFFIFYFGKAFVYKIEMNDRHEYFHAKTSLYFSPFYKTLSLLHLILRDILGSFLCILFNILIFSRIKKLSEKKKRLRNNLALIKSIEAQENKVKMIYFFTLNQILLHLPNFIYSSYGKFFNSKFWTNYSQIAFLILASSYATPFIIYLLFNNRFRDYFLKLIKIKSSNRVESSNLFVLS